MVTMVMMAAALAAQDGVARHVRASEPRVVSLIEAGVSRSETFRLLVKTLNESDVIVYVEPKQTRQALGGFLAHSVVAQGGHRYLHVAVEIHGTERRVVALLAHELQHAVEVAREPDARDAEGLDRLFARLAIQFGCGGTSCSETQAAKNVEAVVGEELAGQARPVSPGR